MLDLTGCAVSNHSSATLPKPDTFAHWWPAKPLNATGLLNSHGNNFNLRVLSDGKGRLRLDISQPKQKINSSTIYNFLTNEVFVVEHNFKTAFLQKGAVEALRLVLDDKSARHWQAKPLGTRFIQGYLCKGWQYADPKTQSSNEVWVADDLGWYVLFNSSAPNSHISIRMQRFSCKKPAAEAFALPADYTIKEMNKQDKQDDREH